MKESLDSLIEVLETFGLRLELSGVVEDVRTDEGRIIVRPDSGNVLKLVTALGKILSRFNSQQPAVSIVYWSYVGWQSLLKWRERISIMHLLIDNAALRAGVRTLQNLLMSYGMLLAFKKEGLEEMLPAMHTYSSESPTDWEDLESWLESTLTEFPPDIADSLRRFTSLL